MAGRFLVGTSRCPLERAMPTTAVETKDQTDLTVDFTAVDLSMVDPMTLQESTSTDDIVQTLSDNSAFMAGFVAAFDEDDGTKTVESGPDDRLTGAGAPLFAPLMDGEWQVATAGEGMTFDTANVVDVVIRSEDAAAPAWFKHDAPNCLGGFGQAGSMSLPFYKGAWTGKDGVVTCSASRDGQIAYFLIDYHAPRPYTAQEQQESKFLAADGSTTLQYYLYKYVQGASAFINFFNPADNLIQGVTGKNLDVFDAENFGSDLSVGERTVQFLQAAAEMVQLKGLGGTSETASVAAKSLHTSGQIAMGISAASSSIGPVAIDIMEKEGYLSKEAASAVRVVVKLGGMADVFMKLRGGEALAMADYLTTLVTLQDAGAEAIKAVIGEEGYKTFWNPNGAWFTELTKNSKNIHDAVELLIDAEKALSKM